MKFLWRGQIREGGPELLQELPSVLDDVLSRTIEMDVILNSLNALSVELKTDNEFTKKLKNDLQSVGVPPIDIESGIQGISTFLQMSSLKSKLKREFGDDNPFNLRRRDYGTVAFEAWSPLGLLVHVAPSNAWSVGFLSVCEGLLAGNINFLKLSSAESEFALLMMSRLAGMDTTGSLANRLFAARIPSSDRKTLQLLVSNADGVAAWGGEEAINSLRSMTPPKARFIEWGPKISFGYVTPGALSDSVYAGLAQDICEGDQQACSSPQCLYVETTNDEILMGVSKKLAMALEKESSRYPALTPSQSEQSEITVVTRLQELKSAIGEGDVIKGNGWRILLDGKSGIRPSPLYRSIWLKKISRADLVKTLRPMRHYLQTVGLAVETTELADVTQHLLAAGVLRITPVGSMTSSYDGEPHDGVFALTQYAKRISLRRGSELASIGEIKELSLLNMEPLTGAVMDKAAFQAQAIADEFGELTFRSGGSSGEPKYSLFTYDDYHAQMRLAGHGLLAAGLNPATDRCMNLFFGGGLYGGFVSFFSILEGLRAKQWPMAAVPLLSVVGDTIVKHRIDTLLGMPSYIIQLFRHNDEQFFKYRGIKKIFYGGEHFQSSQKEYIQNRYGVEIIRSAAYGSVDAGPLGYQCEHCEGSIHHLHNSTHHFEVLKLESEERATDLETGRLVVTAKMREGQAIRRYDIGDLVRVLPGVCGCGRPGPKVELMGRHGDVFRIGASFFNYAHLARLLAEELSYEGEMQMRLLPAEGGGNETMVMVVEAGRAPSDEEIIGVLAKYESDFEESVIQDKVLEFKIERIPGEDLKRVAGSGKLVHVIDERRKNESP